MLFRKKAERLLAQAGITINGPGPIDIQVKDEALYRRVFLGGRLALGEAYMEGWWDVDDLTGFTARLLSSDAAHVLGYSAPWTHVLQWLSSYRQTRTRNRQVAIEHYNLDPRLFEYMLDKRYASYTCGLYRNGANSLEAAQEAKLRLTCEKLQLRPGQMLLDVGSGFTAGLLRYAVEHYGVRGVGVVNSEAQAEKSRACVQGMPIEIRLSDYRDIEGSFDRIVSMGMFEHVGPGNYRTYFKKLRSLLRGDGLALVHMIGTRSTQRTCDAWFHKYIFPNGVAPSIAQVSHAFDGLFVCEDVDNFGADYVPTLEAWYRNLAKHWHLLESFYGSVHEPNFRMMKYYLLGVAGAFRARHMQLHQFVLSPSGVPGGYKPVR